MLHSESTFGTLGSNTCSDNHSENILTNKVKLTTHQHVFLNASGTCMQRCSKINVPDNCSRQFSRFAFVQRCANSDASKSFVSCLIVYISKLVGFEPKLSKSSDPCPAELRNFVFRPRVKGDRMQSDRESRKLSRMLLTLFSPAQMSLPVLIH